jgi:hypothetical protein
VLVEADEVVVESPANRPKEGGMSASVFAKSEYPRGERRFDHGSVGVAVDARVEVADQPGSRWANKYKRANTKREIEI